MDTGREGAIVDSAGMNVLTGQLRRRGAERPKPRGIRFRSAGSGSCRFTSRNSAHRDGCDRANACHQLRDERKRVTNTTRIAPSTRLGIARWQSRNSIRRQHHDR
jgi:hypothetical protein